MVFTRFNALPAALCTAAVLVGLAGIEASLWAQARGSHPVHFQVSGEAQRLEMVVNSSRILTLNYNVPKLLVQNPQVLQASPLSPNQIQVSALRPGVTSINIWDENDKVRSITVRVFGDVRELQDTLNSLFRNASIQARPLQSSILLSGHVPSADDATRAVEVAREYFPRVINHMTVGGVQTVAMHVKVLEVSRTKLREFGIDWSVLWENGFLVQSVSGLINPASGLAGAGDTIRFGLTNSSQVNAVLRLLRQNNLAKLMAEPTLVALSGRAASFNSGGQIPVPIAGGLGTTSVEYREFGTTVDFVPVVLGNGKIRLEVRPQVTEVDASLADPVTGTPGFRARRVDTAVEMKPGQTLALAGLIQNKVESINRGIPWLADLPWFGAPFRRVNHRVNEVELLILVTPQIVSPMAAHEVPPCGPGESTAVPNDVELYWRGYMEVPRCCIDGSCPRCVGEGGGIIGPVGPNMPYEEIQPQQPSEESTVPVPQARRRLAPPPPSPNSARRPPVRSGRRHPVTHVPPRMARRPTPNKPHRPNDSSTPGVARQISHEIAEPGLIGPVGYDVLK